MQGQLDQTMQGQPQGQKGDPEFQRKVDSYSTGLLKMIHGKETRGQVFEMLSSGPPEMTVPRTALTINKRMEEALTNKAQKPELPVLLASGAILVGELLEVAKAGNLTKGDIQPEMAQKILQETFQMYIEDGVKSGKIDPIELQKLVEPMMSDEQKDFGLNAGSQFGVPQEPGVSAAMETYANQRVSKVKNSMSSKVAGKQRQSALMQGGQR